MATFLNKKEQVLDIQLTSHGKYLLSAGKFKPIYYCFLDDNIIYDYRHASGSVFENQKDIIEFADFVFAKIKMRYWHTDKVPTFH